MRIRRDKRNEPIRETQMISLADIAFLIIFFFMFTSSFATDKPAVRVPQVPRGGESAAPLIVGVDAQGRLYLNGAEMGGPDALERELEALLQGKSGPDAQVRLRCEKTLAYKDYRAACQAITNAGGTIAIVHDLPR